MRRNMTPEIHRLLTVTSGPTINALLLFNDRQIREIWGTPLLLVKLALHGLVRAEHEWPNNPVAQERIVDHERRAVVTPTALDWSAIYEILDSYPGYSIIRQVKLKGRRYTCKEYRFDFGGGAAAMINAVLNDQHFAAYIDWGKILEGFCPENMGHLYAAVPTASKDPAVASK